MKGVQKRYRRKSVLQNVSFEMKEGEIVGLVGENGAGKSTLLQILATALEPTAGELRLDGKRYADDFKRLRQMIGYVPQDISVWEEYTVEENMRFFEKLSWQRRSPEECRNLCLDMQLTQWKEPVHTLSGGMKRKLNLAISLLHDPILLLLDEPTVGIDLKSKTEIGRYLLNLAKKEGKMILYTSHDMDEITNVCDRVYSIGDDPFYPTLLKKRGIEVGQLS
ncbi:ABC transporter ATP-binding protein [Sporosarcina sp. Marseille-Q4943]|uniref:ABC transporter ATP-binding protein n=1 Tax=Sporosarcina sp. Marseille-Q4943 TaxID=2942204 RepID=UPI0035323614